MPASISRKNSSKSATANRLDGIFSKPLSGTDGDAGDCTKVRGRLVTPVGIVRNRMDSTPGYGHGWLQPDIRRGGSVIFVSVAAYLISGNTPQQRHCAAFTRSCMQ